MKKSGRIPLFSDTVLRIIADKTNGGELTHRTAAQFYHVSHGAISAWSRKFRTHVIKGQVISKKLTSKEKENRKTVELEIVSTMKTLEDLECEIRLIQNFHSKLFKK